jgi:hypothetical protein
MSPKKGQQAGLVFYVDEARREYEFATRHIDYISNPGNNFEERMVKWIEEIDDVLKDFQQELNWYNVINPNNPIPP